MLKYRGRQLIRAGVIGVVLIVLVIAVGLAPERLVSWATAVRYQAQFADAGGVAAGNDVTVSGIKVGTVSNVALEGRNAVVTFTIDGSVSLGSDTTAHVRTGTLLGERVVTLESKGTETLHPMDVIPLSRTASPYSLTEAVSELTTNTAGTDTASLNQSLDTLSATLDQVAPQLGPAFDGLTRLSQAINDRDDTLGDLLENGADVTKILSDRSEQVNTLILNANDLVAVLSARRYAIVELLAHTSALSTHLSGLIADNEQELAPSLEKLNRVTEVLEKNRDNIAKALPGLAKFQTTLGETIGNGPYYQAYIPNIDMAPILQPFFDYAFGFRRGVNAGQPPDNAGPRAELPFPYNGIPQPHEQWGPPR
ncbi:MCE family protein [Mycolicibacterium celeriflavum]|uniref:Mammalian cell entry protein n=1 Tax=Mycolicibacterium celeriflavum TaxID=1249101 RepID=A0A1X0C377_MYCCF|nr:MCE family protein [Mycolicibacterium celeriflavum]MCV7239595.1 MCE family protein [Mycolicibacterium celeriflavum]ORA51846.1 mammalian cell entry protein [Mycolicibacterium celeriflavum]BBY43287.1 mammalian cell entry protein [Mycolicibacterium celeriflavum]